MAASSSSCGRWNFTQLAHFGVHAHDSEWSTLAKTDHDARPTCCRRRSPQFVRFEPEADALLKPSSVRLLVVLATDSTNATRALTLSNIAAFSQLNQVRASFVVVVGRCGKWASVAAGAAALGVPFDCVLRPPEPSSSPSKNGGGAAFRPKLPLQLHGAMKYLHRMVEETSEEQQQAAEAIAERDALDPGAAGSSSSSSSSAAADNSRFDAIWLPDADVAFTADGVSDFLLRWSCAFSAGPPFVSQPAMHGALSRTGRSQQFWPFNYGREWQSNGRLGDLNAIAMHTAYVEQQAPLLDAPFFVWFVNVIGQPLAAIQRTHGTDVGTDQLWCRAAGHYARLAVEADRRKRARQGDVYVVDRSPAADAIMRPGCAVIPVPFRHKGVQRRRPPAFWKGVGAVRDQAEARWPEYWLGGPLMHKYRLTSEHVELTKSLEADRCMVRKVSSTRLGPACTR